MAFFEGYQQTLSKNFDPLTAPGVTDVVDVHVVNYFSSRNYTMIVTVTDIDDSVVVRLDASLDGVNYGPLISNTITENGTYPYYVNGAPVGFVRCNFLKENGGTNAVVKFSISAN
jgi:hypothetical protein